MASDIFVDVNIRGSLLIENPLKSGIFQGTVNETFKVDFIASKGLNQN